MPAFRILSNGVAWQPWSGAAFARARAEHKPVLLSIAASWCDSCREMDRTSYADPTIATLINERFVPIRVDADERPDISERYNLGGWPTTAFLTPEGQILAGGTFVPLDRIGGVLSQVADTFAAQPEGAYAGRVNDGDVIQAAAQSTAVSESALIDSVFSTFDERYGGFGVDPKFPVIAPLQLALAEWAATRNPHAETILVATLDAMGWSALYDDVDGGFFRYAATREWQGPHVEKLLDVNAALTHVYLDAGAALQIGRFTERAADTLRYIQTWLADPVDGGWRGSQQADRDYYDARSAEARRALTAPAVDESLYADSNGLMVQTALRAAQVFDDDGLRDFAVKSLERVLLTCYKPGWGVAHYFEGHPQVRGLLADQFAMAAACLDVFDLTGNVVYEMMAEELAHYAVRTMWDSEHGGFFDRAAGEPSDPPIGLMGQPIKPFATNCDAARTLRRVARVAGEEEFSSLAARTLSAMAPMAPAQGPLAAHYLLAMRAVAGR
jgi:uncharacterized protein